MIILFKVCTYTDRLTINKGRPSFVKSIRDLIFVCLNSILSQMTPSDKIVFFFDGNDAESDIKKLCNHYKINYELFVFNYRSSAKIHEETIKYITNVDDNEFIYLCEDDYLHFSNALSKIKEFLKKYPMYFCHSIDYPNLYESDPRFVYKSSIILTDTHFWRSIKSTTYTLAFTKKLFNATYDTFKLIKDDMVYIHAINLLYVFFECYSPIPSLSSHISIDCLPYNINTEQEYNNNYNQILNIISL